MKTKRVSRKQFVAWLKRTGRSPAYCMARIPVNSPVPDYVKEYWKQKPYGIGEKNAESEDKE